MTDVAVHLAKSAAPPSPGPPVVPRRHAARVQDSFVKLDPRKLTGNPVILATEVVAAAGHRLDHRRLPHRAPIRGWRSRSRSGSGSRCCSPTSPRASPRAAARRPPTPCAPPRVDTKAKLIIDDEGRTVVPTAGVQAGRGQHRAGRGRRHGPLRRRDHRGRRLGQRVGHHRRVRAGDPRERRRPLGRHRRHHGGLRLDQGAHHRRARATASSTA